MAAVCAPSTRRRRGTPPGAPRRSACARFYARLPAALGGAPRRLLGDDLVAHLLERAADEAGDVHLRDPHLLGDLGLAQPFEAAPPKNARLALVEGREPGRQDCAVLTHLILVLDRPERLEGVEVGVVVSPARRGERERRVGLPALERLEDVFLLDARSLGQLRDRGRALELDGELLEEIRQTHVQFRETARTATPPARMQALP